MSLLALAGLLAVAAGAAGYVSARRARQSPEAPLDATAPPTASEPPAPPPADPSLSAALARLPLRLGDVVAAEIDDGRTTSHQTRWLRGGIVARERGEIVGVVFAAPEGAQLEAVAVFAEPRREIHWMSPRDVEVGVEPPTSLEIDGRVLQRRLRRPVELERIGVGAPDLGSAGLWVEYEGAAGEVSVAIGSGRRYQVWSGVRLAEGRYDRMGSGSEG